MSDVSRRGDLFPLFPFIYMATLFVLFWLTIGLDLNSFDWVVGALAIGFYFTIPIQLHDKVMKIREQLGEEDGKTAICWSRLVRHFAVFGGILFVVQPFISAFLGGKTVSAVAVEVWVEFTGIGLLALCGLCLAKFYELMEKLPKE